ncbi:hypothetical protein IE53DRAFT_29609 [Violaceomyces palustris]|uniref:Uncharacterized protein n=1 Tax=Violaceomyces palustris TaxID=1673888 RepID=A0ACD0P193_9BASI|nr:hypothetical protein IE53DRAFT_29609 [Violaceomyces palustris]
MFCIGLAQFLTFSAMALAILANIGQITQNIVARHIRFVELNTSGFQNALEAAAPGANVGNIYATNQGAPELQGNGIKLNYQWGLYNFCAGDGTSGARSCTDRSFGFEWRPLDALERDAPSSVQSQIPNLINQGTFTSSDYLGRFSKAGFYLIFVGTVLTGLSFIIGFLAHRFAFAFAALSALLGAACLGVGAAVNTAIYTKARDSVSGQYGLELEYGNALWFIWAAFGATALAIVPYIISCFTGRSKY